MPIEVTQSYVRVRQSDPSLFTKGSFRTITIDASAGIKAVIGRRPGKDGTEVQSFMFDKARWSVEDAKRWIAKHHDHATASDMFARDRDRTEINDALSGIFEAQRWYGYGSSRSIGRLFKRRSI